MNPFLSHLHKELRNTRLTRRGATARVRDVPKFLHKQYSRMPSVQLPEPENISITLKQTLEERFSARTGESKGVLTLQDIGTLFGLSLRARSNKKRNYPSGGGLYPVETYLITGSLESKRPTAYHYNPSTHALEQLWHLPDDFKIKTIAQNPKDLELSALIIFTSVWNRSSAKYGDLAYLHALIEVGHMSENILLVATALGLNTRPYAGFSDDKVLKLLDLDELLEQPIHSITLSKDAETKSPA